MAVTARSPSHERKMVIEDIIMMIGFAVAANYLDC